MEEYVDLITVCRQIIDRVYNELVLRPELEYMADEQRVKVLIYVSEVQRDTCLLFIDTQLWRGTRYRLRHETVRNKGGWSLSIEDVIFSIVEQLRFLNDINDFIIEEKNNIIGHFHDLSLTEQADLIINPVVEMSSINLLEPIDGQVFFKVNLDALYKDNRGVVRRDQISWDAASALEWRAILHEEVLPSQRLLKESM